MGRRSKQDGFLASDDSEDVVSDIENTDKESALLAQIEDLKRQLAEKNNPPVVVSGSDDSAPTELVPWEVSLQYAPTRIVFASDQANAWEVYKNTMGIIASEYSPVIVRSSQEQYDQQQMELKRIAGQL